MHEPPGDVALSHTLMRGHITDSAVTAEDIIVAEKLLGPHQACVLSKATLQVRGGQYEHADEIGKHLRCDIVFVGGRKTKAPFHFVVEEKCGHRGIEKLKTQTAISLFEAQMKQILLLHRARGFSPEKLRMVLHAAVTEDEMVRQPYPSGIIQLINEIGDNDYNVDDLVSGASGETNWQKKPYGDTAVNVIRRAAEAHMQKSEHRNWG